MALKVAIGEFAQDGSELAWMTGRCREYSRPPFDWIATRAVDGGQPRVIAQKVCGHPEDPAPGGLTLAARRALFWWPVEGGNGTYYRLATASLGQQRTSTLGTFVRGPGYGIEITGADGHGHSLVYAVADWDTGSACISKPVPCIHSIRGGAVWRIVGGRPIRVPGAAVPAALAVSGDMIAIAPARRRWSGPELPVPAAVNGPVEIRDARTGAVRRRFAPRGRVLELALAGNSAAVIVERASTRRVERYDVRSGRLAGSVRVPGGAADIDIAGDDIVYRVGNDIYSFSGGASAVVARASARPIGLSIDGRRIAWAENIRNRGHIQSITLR